MGNVVRCNEECKDEPTMCIKLGGMLSNCCVLCNIAEECYAKLFGPQIDSKSTVYDHDPISISDHINAIDDKFKELGLILSAVNDKL